MNVFSSIKSEYNLDLQHSSHVYSYYSFENINTKIYEAYILDKSDVWSGWNYVCVRMSLPYFNNYVNFVFDCLKKDWLCFQNWYRVWRCNLRCCGQDWILAVANHIRVGSPHDVHDVQSVRRHLPSSCVER